MATEGRYPLATPDGQAIPLELVNPIGCFKMPLLTSGYSTVTIPELYRAKIFVAYGDIDFYITFASTPTVPSNNTFSTNMYVPAGVVVAFVNTSEAASLSAIATTTAGTIHINVVDTWAGLILETQLGAR